MVSFIVPAEANHSRHGHAQTNNEVLAERWHVLRRYVFWLFFTILTCESCY